jgi:hypothetical protein
MTEPYGFGTSEGEQYYEVDPSDIEERQTNPWPAQPLAVVNATQETAPEFGSCLTWAIPMFGVNQPIQVLPRRIRRHKSYVEVSFTVPGTVYFNSKLDPLSIPNGYAVTFAAAGLYRFPDWETQQPLYIIATVAGLSASVVDMSYGDR